MLLDLLKNRKSSSHFVQKDISTFYTLKRNLNTANGFLMNVLEPLASYVYIVVRLICYHVP